MWIIATTLLQKTGLGKVGAEILMFLLVMALIVAVPLGLIRYGKHLQYQEDLAVMNEYTKQLAQADDIYKDQLTAFRKESDAQLAALTTKARDIQDRKAAVQTIYVTKEVVKYVSKATDKRSVDANVFTRGWVYLHDAPLLAANGVSGVPPRFTGDAEAPTGITASTVATVDGSNLNECRARGEIIQLWQAWYIDAKNKYDWLIKTLPPPVPVPSKLKSISTRAFDDKMAQAVKSQKNHEAEIRAALAIE